MESLYDLVQSSEKQVVVAHRGSSGTAPENTLTAISQALEAGVSMIEIDVQLTADQEIIVFHDPTLERTTNGTGETGRFSYADLHKLDAGSWFSLKFSGERIPLLSDVFAILKGKACINIEIKPPSPHENYRKRIDLIASTTLEAGFAPFTLFSSFHHQSLRYLQSLKEKFYTAAVIIPGDERLVSEIKAAVNCEVVVLSLNQLTEEMAADIQKHDIFTGVYTVNNEAELDKAIKGHVQGIVSDFPGIMIEKLQNKSRLLQRE
ncbi:MAG: hypothetical protein KJ804_05480 [Proteobacteria bacterium]|nr:hypothetical protein [Pseudomonadota bacterium]MBU1057756.1 hypothetical protein [Pseudomonadota bacterium]